ncbi:MAG: hypothetical protein KDK97_00155 [Verrucomicrobiales bacterium]|nr:hypothetical protein [Verrucomicrobiales bacterium]
MLFSAASLRVSEAQVPAAPPTASVPLNALRFSGVGGGNVPQTGQGVTIPELSPSAFNVANALTIEAWVNVNSWTKRFQSIVTKGDSWGIVRADATSKICFRTEISGQPGFYDDLLSAADFPLNSWQHIAAVFTGTKKQLFINGVLSAESDFAGPLVGNTFPVVIGGHATLDRTLEGTVDSVRLWSVARSAVEISERNLEYLRGSEVGLLADWRFNEAAGADANDGTPAGYKGTLEVGKLVGGGSGTAPERVEGLALNPPSDGNLALFFNNPPAEVIVDNGDASGVSLTGTWATVADTAGFYGANYLHDGNTTKGAKSVRFTPALVRSGSYDVYLWWTAGVDRASNTPVDLVHAGGTTTVTIDQRTGGAGWVKLNAVPLLMNAGTTSSVVVSTTGTDGFVVADAARFVAVDNPQFATVTPAIMGGLDSPAAMTAEAWIYPLGLPASGSVALLSKGAAGWEVRYNATGKISFVTTGVQTTIPGGDPTELIGKTRVEPRVWTHVAVVWDGSTETKQIYVNGVLDSTAPAQGVLGSTTLPLAFAAEPSAGPVFTKAYFGVLDEVRFWQVARSAEEVQANHSLRLNGSEPGLAGVWNCNEANAAFVVDGSIGGLDAALAAGMSLFNRVDGVSLGDPLLASYTIALNGVDQAATIADDPAYAGFTSLTIEAWIKPLELPGADFMDIVMKGAAGYGLAIDKDLHLRYLIDINPAHALSSTGVVTLGEWNHVAVVVNGATKTTTFYINGQVAGTVNSAVITSSPGALVIGRHGGSALTNFFRGGIDEVRIWNTARTPTEISLLAFSELPSAGNLGLVGRWSFTEGSGSIVADSVAGRNATLLNTTNASWQTGPFFPDSPTLPPGLDLTTNPRAAGLWIGQVTLNKVNEVQRAVNGVAAQATPTGKPATIRILLHVDATGQVRLLKDVIVMQTQSTGIPPPPAKTVLVTDPSLIPNFQGVVSRGGKLVGLRYGTAAFDFNGLESVMVGGIGNGLACAGRIDLSKDAPTNPYRHKYHPDHQRGFDIIRVFSLQFDGITGNPLAAAPGYGVDRITGTYRESIAGLHKITLQTEGSFTLDRISTVAALNTP